MDQIIYTSAKRGINSHADGMQIYSYTEGFSESDANLTALFRYKPLSIEAEQPYAFRYRKMNDGRCAVVLCTYLGKDYMGKSGRDGNFLAHAIVSDENFDLYPMELLNSPSLRTKMKQSEVNSDDEVGYLPAPTLIEGDVISRRKVGLFLKNGNNFAKLMELLYALFEYINNKRRVVILDSQKNRAMWIAALMYLLPKKESLRFDFCTYEYAPELSGCAVCGAYRTGTAFDISNPALNVFDFEEERYPKYKLCRSLFEYVEKSFSTGMVEFFEFANRIGGFSTKRYYEAFCLFALTGYDCVFDNDMYDNAIKLWNDLSSSAKVELLSRMQFDRGIWQNVSAEMFEFRSRFLMDAYGGNLGHLTTTVLSVSQYAADAPMLERKLVERISREKNKSKREVYSLLWSLGRGDLTFEVYKSVLSNADKASHEFGDYFFGFLMNVPEYAVRYGDVSISYMRKIVFENDDTGAALQLLRAVKVFEPNIILIEELSAKIAEGLAYSDFEAQRALVVEIKNGDKMYSEKMAAFVTGFTLNDCRSYEEYSRALEYCVRRYSLPRNLPQEDMQRYIEWICSKVYLIRNTKEYISLMRLIGITDIYGSYFFYECAKSVVNAFGIGRCGTEELVAYVKLLLYEATPYQRENATKELGTLNRRVINQLDRELVDELEPNMLNRWSNMRVLLVKKRFFM
ncbi:MAG: hypothetical protein PHX51_00555 [Clostridia bacterium]|nr:hypothetical protein [Clostridia bacterium]